MHHSASVFLLCVLTGSSCAVFYTKNSDNDYPRIGRRSFYTTGNGNHYPRIGRRDARGSQLVLPGSSEFSDFPTAMDKRGIFTQGAYGSYPRVGRSGPESEEFLSDRSSKFLEKFEGMKEEAEDDAIRKELQEDAGSAGGLSYPLDLMFIAFDSDNDGKLTKDEFTTGMSKYREHNPLC